MRMATLSSALALLVCGPAFGAKLTATRPGVMCVEPEALAKLTLPNGSSRSYGPNARPEDLATKASGGCIDIPPGATVTVLTARTNTSIAAYDANDGRGERTFVVPNIDFAAVPDAPPAAPARHGPAWPDANYPPLVYANKLFGAVREHCPQQGWNEHLLARIDMGPGSEVGAKLTPAQNGIIEREIREQCTIGPACPADIAFGMEVGMGYLDELVRAICSQKAPADG